MHIRKQLLPVSCTACTYTCSCVRFRTQLRAFLHAARVVGTVLAVRNHAAYAPVRTLRVCARSVLTFFFTLLTSSSSSNVQAGDEYCAAFDGYAQTITSEGMTLTATRFTSQVAVRGPMHSSGLLLETNIEVFVADAWNQTRLECLTKAT